MHKPYKSVEVVSAKGVRNAFRDENKLVMTGVWERERLIELATKTAQDWNANYPGDTVSVSH